MTHEANVPGRDKKRVERRTKSFFIVPDVVRVSNRPRVDDFSDGSSISESTNDNPSIENEKQSIVQTYRLHAHAAPQKCFLDASVAVEVLARADMFVRSCTVRK